MKLPLRISWDRSKNASNQHKHGVSFDVAARVFLDPGRIEMYETVKTMARTAGSRSVPLSQCCWLWSTLCATWEAR